MVHTESLCNKASLAVCIDGGHAIRLMYRFIFLVHTFVFRNQKDLSPETSFLYSGA